MALGFVTDAFVHGCKACYLPMVLVLESEFGWTRSNLSLLAALVHVFILIMTPISGLLIDKHPPNYVIGAGLLTLSISLFLTSFVSQYWHVILSYGVLCGSAYGSLNLNVFSVVVINTIPERKQGLAIGITNAGSTFGHFAMTPLFLLFIRAYNWRLAFVLLAALGILIIVPTLLLLSKVKPGEGLPSVSRTESTGVPVSESVSELSPGEDAGEDASPEAHNSIDKKFHHDGAISEEQTEVAPSQLTLPRKLYLLLSSYPFVAIGVAFFICGVTTTGFIETHMIALVVEDGRKDSMIAAISFSVLSACNGVGMIISGYLSNHMSREYLLAWIFMVRAVSYIVLLLTFPDPGGLTSLFVFATVFGFVDYSVIPPTVSLVNSYVPGMVGFAVGILLMCHSAGAAVGAAAGGWIFDSTNSYDYALLSCAVLCIFAAFSCISASIKTSRIEEIEASL